MKCQLLSFFKDIKIFGLSQHKFAEYVLINPMITDFTHDTYDYAQGNGIMSHSMTIKYETVKYYSGAVSGVRPDTNVVGFADLVLVLFSTCACLFVCMFSLYVFLLCWFCCMYLEPVTG